MVDESQDEQWIVSLQERVRPLCVELPAWGDVLARESMQSSSTMRGAAPRRWIPIASGVAFAAAAVLVLAWPARETSAPQEIAPSVEADVASPPPVAPAPAPAPTPSREPTMVPTPSPEPSVVATPKPIAKPIAKPRPKPRPVRRPAPAIAPPAPPTPADTTPIESPSSETPILETLGTAEIAAAMAPIRELVKQCDDGDHAGTRVIVKLTFSGSLGEVTSASLLRPDEVPPQLGECVLAAARQAQVPRFQKPSLGVVFPFQL